MVCDSIRSPRETETQVMWFLADDERSMLLPFNAYSNVTALMKTVRFRMSEASGKVQADAPASGVFGIYNPETEHLEVEH